MPQANHATPLIEVMDFHDLRGRVGTIEQVVQRIEQATSSIAESLQTLARLEERHSELRVSLTTAWEKIDDQAKDITDLKTQLAAELPPLKETRKWVVSGMVALVGIVFLSLVGLVLIPH